MEPVCPNEEIKKHVAGVLHQATPEHSVETLSSILMFPKEKGVDFQIPVPALRGRLQLKGDPMTLVVNKWLAVRVTHGRFGDDLGTHP